MHRFLALALVSLLSAAALAGCAEEPGGSPTPTGTPSTGVGCEPEARAPDEAWDAQQPRVRLVTSHGDIVLALDQEGAPATVENFLGLVRSGYYEGETFYRVVPGFVIQGGSRSSAPDKIPDEFNPTLRHDAPGIVSMATAGPDTGSSEFFITLAPTPALDDRHSVFGRVVEGMDVVNRIGSLAPPGQSRYDGPPTETVTIERAVVEEPQDIDAEHAVGIHAVIESKKTEPQRAATFSVILQNEGTTRDAIGLRASVPDGWSCSVNDRPIVPAGTGRVVFVSLTPPAGASGASEIELAAVSAWNGTEEATTRVQVSVGELGAAVRAGDRVTANYAGFLPDGRLFDTSIAAVGTDADMPKLDVQGGWRGAGRTYEPFSFTVGSGVIQGFTDLALTAKAGETVTGYIEAEKAYAQGNMYERPLTGRDLVFELEIVRIG